MPETAIPYRIYPLGDSACCIDWGGRIDPGVSRLVMARKAQLEGCSLPGITEITPAYSSLTLYYDAATLHGQLPPGTGPGEWLRAWLDYKMQEPLPETELPSRLVRLPVCYAPEFAPDLNALSVEKNLPAAELVRLHTETVYQVYMLGFLPGFAYMGEVDERIAAPRKPQPANVAAGSVGIAGRQTGVYPLDSPGGWAIIGRTPLQLFDTLSEEPCLLRAGDRVQFVAIGPEEFSRLSTSLQTSTP